MIVMTVEGAPSQKLIDLSDEMMESFFKYSGISQYRKLCFAAHELVTNAVEAVLRQQEAAGSDHRIEARMPGMFIRMELNGEDIVITISAQGALRDGRLAAEIPRISFDDLLREERGKGLLMAKRLSDQLTFEQDGEGRIIMQLRKKGGIDHQEDTQKG